MYINVVTPSLSEDPKVDIYLGSYDDPVRTELRLKVDEALTLATKLAQAVAAYQDKVEAATQKLQTTLSSAKDAQRELQEVVA